MDTKHIRYPQHFLCNVKAQHLFLACEPASHCVCNLSFACLLMFCVNELRDSNLIMVESKIHVSFTNLKQKRAYHRVK